MRIAAPFMPVLDAVIHEMMIDSLLHSYKK
jgi:hypothetical protein